MYNFIKIVDGAAFMGFIPVFFFLMSAARSIVQASKSSNIFVVRIMFAIADVVLT